MPEIVIGPGQWLRLSPAQSESYYALYGRVISTSADILSARRLPPLQREVAEVVAKTANADARAHLNAFLVALQLEHTSR